MNSRHSPYWECPLRLLLGPPPLPEPPSPVELCGITWWMQLLFHTQSRTAERRSRGSEQREQIHETLLELRLYVIWSPIRESFFWTGSFKWFDRTDSQSLCSTLKSNNIRRQSTIHVQEETKLRFSTGLSANLHKTIEF